MTDEPHGGIRVQLDGDDIQHLMKHGTSVVNKEVGPITVEIACRSKIYHKFILDDGKGNREEVLEDD